MAWVRLDDGFPEHPKVARAGDLAAWLYVCGLTYANRQATDGYIPASIVPRLTGLKNPLVLAKKLVAVGLWEPADDDGYRIHDYLDYQPSSDRVRRERDANAARQSSWRTRRNGVTPPVSNAVINEWVTGAPYPVPVTTQPEDAKELEGPDAVGAAAPPAAADDSLDRVNRTLTGQPGWTATPEQLRKLSEVATSQRLDLELEALKIVDWFKSPKGKGRQCSFRFVANWLGTGARASPVFAAPATNGTGPRPRGTSRAKHH